MKLDVNTPEHDALMAALTVPLYVSRYNGGGTTDSRI